MYFPENGRILILGVGYALCGDDGVGPYIVEELKKRQLSENVFILNAEEVPEIYTDKIISFLPDYILIIDAIDFKKNPGDFAIISADVLKEKMPSTHSPSLKVVIDYLKSRIDVNISILGI